MNSGGPRIATDQPGRIELNLTLNPLQFILHAVTPRVWVNGHPLAAHWGRQGFDMPAGPHRVACAFPYLFTERCCPAEMVVPVYSGHVTIVSYEVPTFMFSAGVMAVLSTLPMMTHR